MHAAPASPRFPGTLTVAPRVAALSVLAAAVGLGAHLAGGGTLTVNGVGVLAVLGIAATTSWLAQVLATHQRSSMQAFSALGAGQLGIELALYAGDRSLGDPLAAVALHLAANLVLGLVLVGGQRVAADLAAALDRVLPRLAGRVQAPAPPRESGVVFEVLAVVPRGLAQSPRTLRGPPPGSALT